MNHGQKLKDMLNASYAERIFYSYAKEKYVQEEEEKYKAIFEALGGKK